MTDDALEIKRRVAAALEVIAPAGPFQQSIFKSIAAGADTVGAEQQQPTTPQGGRHGGGRWGGLRQRFAEQGEQMGFKNVAAGPLVRSSYHADQQARGL